MAKKKNPFEHFESEEYRKSKQQLLMAILEVKLNQKGELVPSDVTRANEQCRVIFEQDLKSVAKKSCLYLNSEKGSIDHSKCCLFQLVDAKDLQLDAVELVHRMWPSFVSLVYHQSEEKRLQIRDHLKIVVLIRRECPELTDGDISTFPGLFEVLLKEMNGIDEGRFGEYFKLKPHLEDLLIELGPKIVSKVKKYQDHQSLGYSECEFCNSGSTEEPSEPSIKNLSNLPCFKNPRDLEKFLVLTFRRKFYAELMHFITDKFTVGDFFADDFDN